MRDVVFIEDLRIETVIGIYAWERDIRQTVSLTLELANDNRRAAASGRVEDTLDYHAVATRLSAFVRDHRFGLMESLAERCAELILAEFSVGWLRLRARKLGALPDVASVGVEIERGSRR